MATLSVGNLLLSVGPQSADDDLPPIGSADDTPPASLDGSDGFAPVPAAGS